MGKKEIEGFLVHPLYLRQREIRVNVEFRVRPVNKAQKAKGATLDPKEDQVCQVKKVEREVKEFQERQVKKALKVFQPFKILTKLNL